MIREVIVTTTSEQGRVHIAPMGLIEAGADLVIAPFRPSATLENLTENPFAVANYTTDVMVFARCILGHRDWPTRAATEIPGVVLEQALAHAELKVVEVTDDELRPRFRCAVVREETHRPFQGFNRAQAAVIEAAILVSRLDMLPPEKIDAERAYLEIAISKTGGPRERDAWDLLMARVDEHRAARGAAAANQS